MKKIVVSLCLLYAANGYAGAGRIAAAFIFGTTPVTIPAFILYPKLTDPRPSCPDPLTEQEKEEMKKKFAEDSHKYKQFTGNAMLGIIPGVNMGHFDMMNGFKNACTAEKAGFYSALSVYLTLPAAYKALSLLKKAK